MNKPVVAFDFDKTLTNRDTIFGFYSVVDEANFVFKVKRLILVLVALIYKVGFISNDRLKQFGVILFLKNLSEELVEMKAKEYARKIEINQIYYQHYQKIPKDKRIIITASFENYVRNLFPDELVIGSKLAFKKKKVIGLERNMFGEAKKRYLVEKGIDEIECLYTDSYSDAPLMEISKKVRLVKNGQIINTFKRENF